MMNSGKSISDFVTAPWEGIFEEVSLNGMPLHYISSIIVHFHNGKSWHLTSFGYTENDFAEAVHEILSEYKHQIINVSVKMNTVKVKSDVDVSLAQLFVRSNVM